MGKSSAKWVSNQKQPLTHPPSVFSYLVVGLFLRLVVLSPDLGVRLPPRHVAVVLFSLQGLALQVGSFVLVGGLAPHDCE